MRDARVDQLAWGDFLASLVGDDAPRDTRWHPGEHVSLIGPTGGGKTTLARELVRTRRYCVAYGTKPRDSSLLALKADGFRLARTWPPDRPRRVPILPDGTPYEWRVLLWPRIENAGDERRQWEVFSAATSDVFRQGGWTLFVDELAYLHNYLSIRRPFERIWLQGRSVGVSLVAATQRPAWVSLSLYTQATHLFFWQTNDEVDLRRIGGIGSMSSALIRQVVATLDRHEFLYLNSRTGRMAVSRVAR